MKEASKIVNSNEVSKLFSRSKLQNRSLGIFGFFLGVKLADYLFYSEKKFELIAEELEDDYWQKNGKPELIKPTLVPSLKPGFEDQLRDTFISIQLEKDDYISRDWKED